MRPLAPEQKNSGYRRAPLTEDSRSHAGHREGNTFPTRVWHRACWVSCREEARLMVTIVTDVQVREGAEHEWDAIMRKRGYPCALPPNPESRTSWSGIRAPASSSSRPVPCT